MNLKDFLMDNYIYIIIVIVLIIITIIGFLADKKKSEGKKMTLASNNNTGYDPNAGGQINYQPNNNVMNGGMNAVPNNLQMNNNIAPANNQIVEPLQNNNVGVIPQPMNGMNLNTSNTIQPNNVNIPQPVEPMNNVPVNPEPIYQPLAEQQNIQNNVGISQPMEPMNYNQAPSVANSTGVVANNINQPINNPNTVIPGGPIPQVNQPNAIPPINNDTPVPTQTMPIGNPVPQGNPMPIPNPTENTIPNPITPPQPVNPTQVGFVYGPQSNNNNNM